MTEVLSQFNFWASIDILILAFIIYHLLIIISGTRAAQVLTGVLFVIAAWMISSVLPLTALNKVMSKFYSSFFIILVILFQEDIRHVLSRMGKKPFIPNTENVSPGYVIDEIARAVQSLASRRIGALIVIERNIILSRYVEIGIKLDARVSKEILVSIFQTSGPIHDGAVIIQRGRIAAAGCFLPLTRKENLDPNLGTRHRAAIGISQETDAIVVTVSEEVGIISLVVDGRISRRLDAKNLRQELRDMLMTEEDFEDEETVVENEPGSVNLIPDKLRALLKGVRK